MKQTSDRRTPRLAWIVILACVAVLAGKALVTKAATPSGDGGHGTLEIVARVTLSTTRTPQFGSGVVLPEMVVPQLASLEGPGVERGLRLAVMRASLVWLMTS